MPPIDPAEALRLHEAEILDIPGVVGTGIGAGPDGGPVLHVYVLTPEVVEAVRERVVALLPDQPFELIVMGLPEAQA